ncbi:MAG: DUF4271 domain-containing protein [Bacteroidales bacterium]|jgi:hypothetical protein|nr:DUF4271 domain-containing protein [Bacteroidales bacterium]HOI32531.1 DUF4271 domain-containing protein [Bacteroidales bacterium]
MSQAELYNFLIGKNDSTLSTLDSTNVDTIGLAAGQTFITKPHGTDPVLTHRSHYKSIDPYLLLLIGLSAVSLVLVKHFMPRRFFQLLGTYTANRWLNQLLREWNPSKSMPGPAVVLSYIFLLALMLGLVLSKNHQLANPQIGIILNIASVVFLFTLVRQSVSKFISLIFRNHVLNIQLRTIEFSHYLIASLTMIPSIIGLLLYPNETGFYISLILVSIVFIFSFIRTFFYSLGAAPFSVFYLFLYLCALEIVPFLLLLKTISLVLTGEILIFDTSV